MKIIAEPSSEQEKQGVTGGNNYCRWLYLLQKWSVDGLQMDFIENL